MKIVRIFDNCLFAIIYDEESTDEFDRIFNIWNDVDYLENFFESNKTDIQNSYWDINSVDEAIIKTINDAKKFEKILLDLSEKSNEVQAKGLETLFKPLINSQVQKVELNKSKAKQNWLRIYALRIENSIYLITGGAIKLTATMQEREHTKIELFKLEKCRKYLLAQGIIDVEGVIEEIEISDHEKRKNIE